MAIRAPDGANKKRQKVNDGTRDIFCIVYTFSEIQKEQIKYKIIKKMKKYVRNSALLVLSVALCANPFNDKLIYKYLFDGKHCHCC